jgi:hypothetical protein
LAIPPFAQFSNLSQPKFLDGCRDGQRRAPLVPGVDERSAKWRGYQAYQV